MVDNDIDGELTEEEAHHNYGVRVADWLSINALHLELLTQDQAQQALFNMADYEAATAEFLLPFVTMHQIEQLGFVSQNVEEAQVSKQYSSNLIPYIRMKKLRIQIPWSLSPSIVRPSFIATYIYLATWPTQI